MHSGGLAILVELDDRLARISTDIFLALIEHSSLAMLDEIALEHSRPGQIIDPKLVEEPGVGAKEFFPGHDAAIVAEAEIFGDAELYARLNDVAEDGLFLQVVLKFRQMFLVHPCFEDSRGMMQPAFTRPGIDLRCTKQIQFLHVPMRADDLHDQLHDGNDRDAEDEQSDHPA